MKKWILLLLCCLGANFTIAARVPSWFQLDGSMMPLDTVPYNNLPQLPDSLRVIGMNHVGRHGSRFLSKASKTRDIDVVLQEADRQRLLTPAGKRFRSILAKMDSLVAGRWGALSDVGQWEEKFVARKIFEHWPQLIDQNVEAKASRVSRVANSMYAFCGELASLKRGGNITASEGPKYSSLLRFFETDSSFLEFKADGKWLPIYNMYLSEVAPEAPARRLVRGLTSEQARKLSMQMYDVISGFAAIGVDVARDEWFSYDDYLRAWKVSDVEHELLRTNAVSESGPLSAAPLLRSILAYEVNLDQGEAPVALNFGHAETLMPLLALMGVEGCVASEGIPSPESMPEWKDYEVVPLGANFIMIWSEAPSGTRYVLSLLNGRPVSPAPGLAPLCPANDLAAAWTRRLASIRR